MGSCYYTALISAVVGIMEHKQERQFGVVFAIVFAIVAFWPVWPLQVPNFYWLAAAAVMLVLGVYFPRPLSPFNRVWLAIGHGLGWINARIILGFIFFVIVTPIALFMKLLGRDLLHCRLQHSGSYWVGRDIKWTKESMRNQF